MEFYDVGANCSFCKQKDFLPVTCEYCKEIFCSNHKFPEEHFCSKFKKQTGKKENQINLKKCTKCDENSIIQCKICKFSFCSTHHLPEVHECKTKKVTLKKMIIKNENEFKNTFQDSFGELNLFPKDRIYLKILFPLNLKQQPSYWYFRKDRKIGKVIDILVSKEKLKLFKNYNLYRFYNGIYLNSSDTLNDLMEKNVLKNGDYLILEEGKKNENLNEMIGIEYMKLLIFSKDFAIDLLKK